MKETLKHYTGHCLYNISFYYKGKRFEEQANLIGPSLPKNETMEAPQNRRFYFEV
jgi:hypothetical protein